MRNQTKYDVPERTLNAEERAILEGVNSKNGIKLDVAGVEYERHVPRATVCIAYLNRRWGLSVQPIIGVTLRSKKDIEAPEVGRLYAFQRALEDYIERKRKRG